MLLQVKNLNYSIHGKEILSNISFSAAQGQRWAVIGKNGAGKSTFIKCIAGLCAVTQDAISIDGKPLSAFSPKQRGKIMAYVPQISEALLPFSVYDFVMMGRFPHFGIMAKVSREDKKIVEKSLELTELTDYFERRMDSLSGGELQRVFIAGAVAQRTPLLLMDEPTTFLDPNHQQYIKRSIDRIHESFKVTIITVTHDIASLFTDYSHVLAFKGGNVSFSGASSMNDNSQVTLLHSVFDVPFVAFTSPRGETLLAARPEECNG